MLKKDAASTPPDQSNVLSVLQTAAESVVADVTSSEGRGPLPLHLPLNGCLLPAVPGVVVLLGQPEHSEGPHLPPFSSATPPPAAGLQWGRPDRRRRQKLSAVSKAAHQRHGSVHLWLRLLLPLHLHVCESQPPLPSHRVSQRTAAPHQDLLTRELEHISGKPRPCFRQVPVQVGANSCFCEDEHRCAAFVNRFFFFFCNSY